VSNFDDRDLAELLEHAKIAPAANQVIPSPSVFTSGS
jgi:diketogulonate reductase-like aldo/keto reductase